VVALAKAKSLPILNEPHPLLYCRRVSEFMQHEKVVAVPQRCKLRQLNRAIGKIAHGTQHLPVVNDAQQRLLVGELSLVRIAQKIQKLLAPDSKALSVADPTGRVYVVSRRNVEALRRAGTLAKYFQLFQDKYADRFAKTHLLQQRKSGVHLRHRRHPSFHPSMRDQQLQLSGSGTGSEAQHDDGSSSDDSESELAAQSSSEGELDLGLSLRSVVHKSSVIKDNNNRTVSAPQLQPTQATVPADEASDSGPGTPLLSRLSPRRLVQQKSNKADGGSLQRSSRPTPDEQQQQLQQQQQQQQQPEPLSSEAFSLANPLALHGFFLIDIDANGEREHRITLILTVDEAHQISSNASLNSAHGLFANFGSRQRVFITRQGRLVGVISRSDIQAITEREARAMSSLV